jgi:hypothetical protein
MDRLIQSYNCATQKVIPCQEEKNNLSLYLGGDLLTY